MNQGQIGYLHPSDSMVFYTAGAERVRVDGSGNMGIGTSSPGAALEVNGTILTGSLSIQNGNLSLQNGLIHEQLRHTLEAFGQGRHIGD